MHFKKIYLEITNACNLNCSFCIGNKRKITNLTIDNFEYIINKIKNYTDEVYFHILGEPLIHNDIEYFIEFANKNNLLVNITTNGYLIKKIKNIQGIHRLNISLHSFNDNYGLTIDEYINNIFEVIETMRNKTFISLRLWVNSKDNETILKLINEKYHTNINHINSNSKIKVTNNLIIDTFHEFIWPDLNNTYYSELGTCKGLITHIGILSDGRVVPCCLDTKGILTLGNIYVNDLDEILKDKRVKMMIDGFKNGYKCEELCRHCSFISNRNEG